MGKFIFGVFTGILLTLAAAYMYNSSNESENSDNTDNTDVVVEEDSGLKIDLLDAPKSYEGKSKAAFEVFQVLDNYALAHEAEDLNFDFFFGKTVLLKSENTKFYNGLIIRLNKPKQIGTYSYKDLVGQEVVVPVIDID